MLVLTLSELQIAYRSVKWGRTLSKGQGTASWYQLSLLNGFKTHDWVIALVLGDHVSFKKR